MKSHSTVRRLVLGVCLLLALGLAQAADKLLLGINADSRHSPPGRMMTLIYTEVFRKLGMDVEFRDYPALRNSAEVESGRIDGEAARGIEYAAVHPDLVRVEEPVMSFTAAAYSANPAISVASWADLKGKPYRVEYRAGYQVLMLRLEAVVPKSQLSTVSESLQGVKKAAAGRTDVYVDILEVIEPLLQSQPPALRARLHRVGTPDHANTYLYLNKKHEALAPRIAAILKDMRAKGTIERYRIQAQDGDKPADARSGT